MSSQRKSLTNYVNWRMRVTLLDGRQLVGRFMAFDRHMNVVLGDAEEFRRLPPKKGVAEADRNVRRPLGLALVRGEEVISLTIEGPPPTDDRRGKKEVAPVRARCAGAQLALHAPNARSPLGLLAARKAGRSPAPSRRRDPAAARRQDEAFPQRSRDRSPPASRGQCAALAGPALRRCVHKSLRPHTWLGLGCRRQACGRECRPGCLEAIRASRRWACRLRDSRQAGCQASRRLDTAGGCPECRQWGSLPACRGGFRPVSLHRARPGSLGRRNDSRKQTYARLSLLRGCSADRAGAPGRGCCVVHVSLLRCAARGAG